ncbi:hypothetical protein [Streptomyces gilvosporeus]|uniref:Uncharacterized protein n=1 Tax=Streptomyces gilvosporeus TaxID=553510 RepID=A0A1V0TVE0_9ACTN|nr:hypothetical protein [Streptomyces gilvosporeus]ARF56924.1 hypothetical protein B1H19_24585 [Streptomyces gilvosporeus]
MSDLVTVSAEIAPYLTLAANSLGTAVIAAAQQRIAERTVTAGEGFFRRLLHGRDGLGDGGQRDGRPGTGADGPVLDARRADALDRLLADLGDEDRRLLSDAVTAWLREPADRRDAPRLREHVAQLAPRGSTTVINYGSGGIAAGEIGTIYMGGAGTSGPGDVS